MIIIPEQRLKQIIDYCLKTVKDNYRDTIDKEDSYLAKIFNPSDTTESYEFDYFKNAVSLFTRTNDHPRHIETHFFLNRARFSLPTIHITLGQNTDGPNGLGFDKNWDNSAYDEETTGARSFRTQFQVMLTSDNTFEVLMMYYLLSSCLIGNVHLLELNGLYNASIRGNDILLENGLVPDSIYVRALIIDCMYDMVTPKFTFNEGPVNDIILNGILKDIDKE